MKIEKMYIGDAFNTPIKIDLPLPSNLTPKSPSYTPSAGNSYNYARADHQHLRGEFFPYDSNIDYIANYSFVIGSNGIPYRCIKNTGPGTGNATNPVNDATKQYWISLTDWIGSTDVSEEATGNSGIWNKQDIIEESGTWTAPQTGWYKLLVAGGGSAGRPGSGKNTTSEREVNSGAGGSQGERVTKYIFLEEGSEVNIQIGAGGIGSEATDEGRSGGDTTVTIENQTITAKGGMNLYVIGGGTGILTKGMNGTYGGINTSTPPLTPEIIGGNGAGNWGGVPVKSSLYGAERTNGKYGCGGAGGSAHALDPAVYSNGGNGGDGFVLIEYFEAIE